jgi:putative peptide zinc metalloprotease protein
MTRLRTVLVILALLAGIVVADIPPSAAQESPSPSAAPSGGAGGDTVAVAINTKDGFDVFRFAFAIKRAMGDVVDNGNAAVAFASCTDCQTVAVSFQLVLMMNDPSIVTPTNLAIAINQECTLCETLAEAFQVILTTDGPVHFTAAGNQEIAAIRRELLSIRKAGLSIEEIVVRVDALMDRFLRVVADELVDAGPASGTPTPATAGSASATPLEPSPSTATSPTASPSATETASTTSTSTPTPTP